MLGDTQATWRQVCMKTVPIEKITLRDYFAAQAMQGMVVDVEEPKCNYIAKIAYEMADAMLEARKNDPA
jgi:hypothetical protein